MGPVFRLSYRSLYSEIYEERLGKLKAEREQTELENAIMRGDYLSRVELESSFSQIVLAVLEVVKSSKLSREEQDDLRRQLAAIPVVIKAVATRNGRNGATHRRNGEDAAAKTKAKSAPAKKAKAPAAK